MFSTVMDSPKNAFNSDADPQWLYAESYPPNLVSADPDPESLTIKIKSLNFSKNIYS